MESSLLVVADVGNGNPSMYEEHVTLFVNCHRD